MNADKKFSKAKIGLLLDEPFFGSLLCNLDCKPAKGIKTMCTDGIRLKWDPAFVDSLDPKVVSTVLAHEVLHCALTHQLRRGDRSAKRWNKACDYAVNSILEDANETAKASNKPLPFPWPTDPPPLLNSVFRNMGAEAIYSQLPDDPPPGKPGQGGAPGQDDQPGMGEVEEPEGAKDEAQRNEEEARWKVNLQNAETMAKGRGTIPAALARLLDELLRPETPWEELLRRFVKDNARDDYSWLRPNPRYMHTGFMLPSLHSQKLGQIVVAIDTSGSIAPETLRRFCSELDGILSEARPAGVVCIDCDAEIGRIIELQPGDILPKEWTGGGGTDFRPVFDYVARQGIEPACLIYLTDLDGTFPDNQPGYPVLWGSYQTEDKAPWGETVRIDK